MEGHLQSGFLGVGILRKVFAVAFT